MNNNKEIMTHIVAGYPSIKDNEKMIGLMVANGVKYIEIQIPFSDPIADGPTILYANQKSLNSGTTTKTTFRLIEKLTSKYPNANFIIMTYFNIIYNYGITNFIDRAKSFSVYGMIVPDIPFDEEDDNFYKYAKDQKIKIIPVVSPTTSIERFSKILKKTDGLIYCTSKVGITGIKSQVSKTLKKYVLLLKEKTQLPVAIGFGIDSKEKVKQISQYADIIIIGSKLIRIQEENYPNYSKAITNFFKEIK